MLDVDVADVVERIDQQLSQLRLDEPAQSIRLATAIAGSLTRAAGACRTAMATAVARDLGVRAADVRPYLAVRPAPVETLEARVFAMPRVQKGIPLGKLDPSGPQPSRGQGSGVSVRGESYPHAFIAHTRSGHLGVFQRQPGRGYRGPRPNRSQLPIDELRTPSVTAAFAAHRAVGIARAQDTLRAHLVRDISGAVPGLI